MSAISNILRNVSTVAMWGGVCAMFGFFLGTRNLIFAGLILIGIMGLVFVQLGPRVLALVWIVGQPSVFSLPNQILKVVPLVNVERVLFVSIVGMVAMNMIFGRKRYASLTSLDVLMIVFLAYALISVSMSAELAYLRKDLWFYMQYVIPMTFFMIARRLDWSDHDMRVLFAWLTVAGAITAVIGVAQLYLGITLFVPSESSTHADDRAVGTFTNPSEFATVLSMCFLLTLLQYSWYRDALIRFVLLGAMLAMAIAIVIAKTRAPWLGLACAIGIIFLRDRSVRPLITVGTVLACVGLVALWSLMADQIGMEDRVTNVDTMHSRIINWATSINMIVHNPLFGIGFGYNAYLLERDPYMIAVGSIAVQDGVSLSTPHNEFLSVGVLLGIPGLCMFIGIIYLLLRLLVDKHVDSGCSPQRRQCALYVLSIVVCVLVVSMFTTTAKNAYLLTATFFLVAFVTGMPGVSGAGSKGGTDGGSWHLGGWRRGGNGR